MKNKISKIFLVIGALLICSALALVIFNVTKSKKCYERSQQVMVEIKKNIPAEFIPDKSQQKFDEIVGSDNENDNNSEKNEYIEIDGNKYLGFIRIEKINLELPIMLDWSYKKMDTSPCVYQGSISSDNLIVMAHNYSGFFINLDELSSGDLVEIIKCNGEVVQYEVTNTQLIKGNQNDVLVADNDQWDLTLFTCNYTGKNRVVVRTSKIN